MQRSAGRVPVRYDKSESVRGHSECVYYLGKRSSGDAVPRSTGCPSGRFFAHIEAFREVVVSGRPFLFVCLRAYLRLDRVAASEAFPVVC
jgi:hypothetical protein